MEKSLSLVKVNINGETVGRSLAASLDSQEVSHWLCSCHLRCWGWGLLRRRCWGHRTGPEDKKLAPESKAKNKAIEVGVLRGE